MCHSLCVRTIIVTAISLVSCLILCAFVFCVQEDGSHVSLIIYLFIEEKLLQTLYKQAQHAMWNSGHFLPSALIYSYPTMILKISLHTFCEDNVASYVFRVCLVDFKIGS
jgi:hypothetical protein